MLQRIHISINRAYAEMTLDQPIHFSLSLSPLPSSALPPPLSSLISCSPSSKGAGYRSGQMLMGGREQAY